MTISMKSKQQYSCKWLLITCLMLQCSLSFTASIRDKPKEAKCLQFKAEKVKVFNFPQRLPLVLLSEQPIPSKEVLVLKPRPPSNLLADLKKNLCHRVNPGFEVVLPNTQDVPFLEGALMLITPSNYLQQSSVILKLHCDTTTHCLNITFSEEHGFVPKRLSRRSVPALPEDSGAQGSSVAAALVVTAVGLLVLVSVAALCGGSKTYETTRADVKLNTPEQVQVSVVSPQPIDTNTSPPSNQQQNGSLSREPPQPAPVQQDPSSSLTPPPADTTDKQERARSLSARSYDPLPELPKLELAEDAIEDKDDDDDPYSYARVPQADEVPQSESSDEEAVDSPNEAAGVPPYGKVTSDKGKGVTDGEYAEVVGDGKRDRSVTAPVDPSELSKVRDARAFTESATHLPLPAIPKVPRPLIEENDTMYDSIPEDVKQTTKQPKKKDRLYESMDDMADDNEDMYESVPEELKPDSPASILSPAIGTPSSPDRLLGSPKPPDSPIPTHKVPSIEKPEEPQPQGKGKKKALEKTLSAGDPEKQKGRSFSLFGRKKAPSVSAAAVKASKKKQEKEGHQTKPHQGEPLPDIPSPKEIKPHQGQPLPDIPTPKETKPHQGEPLPPTPTLVSAPGYDDDEDMYDRPQLPLENEPKARHISESDVFPAVRTTEEAKARAKTLPAGMRSAGPSVFKSRQDLPLPEVPEDSGKGTITVARSRRLEDGTEISEPYDIVQITTPPPNENDDEPNYDTVRPELILQDPSSEVRGDNDPGYDKVGIKLDQDTQSGSERSTSPGADITITNVGGMSSPEDSMIGGASPEHDEVGYAQVPEMYRLRKRAMSATQGDKPKPKTNSKTSADDSELGTTSPEHQYAIIDKAKKKPKKTDEAMLSIDERESGGASPVPPPIPPALDLGDVSEFDQPPLPERSEEMEQLVVNVESDAGYSRVLKVTPNLSAEPPYAKVKSKDEHPYAELKIADGEDTKPDIIEPVESPKPTVNEMSSGYDSVGPQPSTTETDSEPTTGNGPLYDSLEPTGESSPPEVSISVGSPELQENMYDSLEPQAERASPEMEGPYDVIDEDKRIALRKMHQEH